MCIRDSSTTAVNISNTTGMSLQEISNIAETEMGLPTSLATGQGETITGVTPIKPDVILDPSALIPPTLDTSADTTVDHSVNISSRASILMLL